MAKLELNREFSKDGVNVLSEINNEFGNIYLKVRKKEKRIYSDEELRRLPFPSDSNPHKMEWDLRVKSFLRFNKYLETRKEKLNILDLGCGNGWLCGQLSKSYNHNYYCIDINFTELVQGQNNFGSEQVKFIYADIFSSNIPPGIADIIILNAAVQYFPDLIKLLDRLIYLLSANGEVHIIDSPFYNEIEVNSAEKRTLDYYNSNGFPQMVNYYSHHSLSALSGFNFKMLYNPISFSSRIKRLFSIKDSPFPWIKITR